MEAQGMGRVGNGGTGSWMIRELENRELGLQGIQSEGNEGSMELGGQGMGSRDLEVQGMGKLGTGGTGNKGNWEGRCREWGSREWAAARQWLTLEGALLPRVAVPPSVSHKSLITKIFDHNITALID